MRLLLRLLAVLLALSTGGAFDALAAARGAAPCAEEGEAHEDEEGCGDCSEGCSTDCCPCVCCPARTVPILAMAQELDLVAPQVPIQASSFARPTATPTRDIFQPPRR